MSKRKSLILIVDDDADFSETMVEIFQKEGFETLMASRVTEALTMLTNNSPAVDAIISDLNMPGKSGLDFLTALRSMGKTIPFFFLTASDQLTLQKAINSGAQGLFTKTSSLLHLTKILRDVIAAGPLPKKKSAGKRKMV